MKNTNLITSTCFAVTLLVSANAADTTSILNGDWNTAATWSNGVPAGTTSSNTARIETAVTLNAAGVAQRAIIGSNVTGANSLFIGSNGALVTGDSESFIGNGTNNVGNGALSIDGGSFVSSGSNSHLNVAFGNLGNTGTTGTIDLINSANLAIGGNLRLANVGNGVGIVNVTDSTFNIGNIATVGVDGGGSSATTRATLAVYGSNSTIASSAEFLFRETGALSFFLDAGGASTVTAGTSVELLSGSTLNLDLLGGVAAVDLPNSIVLMEAATAVNGAFTYVNWGDLDQNNWSLAYTDKQVVLTAIPEPSSFALLAGCLALGAVMVRRHRA
ncbi:hypothetical protein ACWPKO_03640 [Coraliomargarita sp. W4R53]